MTNSFDIMYLRRKLYEEIHKLPAHRHNSHWACCLPEKKDFDIVKEKFLTTNCNQQDAEELWNFIRYMW